jgi:hypothetical protein
MGTAITLKKKGSISASSERSVVMERLFALAEQTPYLVIPSQRPIR